MQALGLSGLKVAPDPVLVASEAALWRAIHQGLLPGHRDCFRRRGPIRVGAHALAPDRRQAVRGAGPANEQRNAIEIAKRMIWRVDRALKHES